MSVTYEWYDDQQTIVHVRMSGRWRWDDVFAVTNAAARDKDGQDDSIVAIVDMRETNHMPMDVTKAARGMQPFAPHHRHNIYVDPPRMMRMGLDIVLRAVPDDMQAIQFDFVDTFDQALAKARAIRDAE
jgi:hypothetical protein